MSILRDCFENGRFSIVNIIKVSRTIITTITCTSRNVTLANNIFFADCYMFERWLCTLYMYCTMYIQIIIIGILINYSKWSQPTIRFSIKEHTLWITSILISLIIQNNYNDIISDQWRSHTDRLYLKS